MTFDGKLMRLNFLLSCLIIGCFFCFSKAMSSEQTLSGIVHFPVKSASEGRQVSIEAKIEDPNIKIQYMRLYYRQKGQSSFQRLDMREQLNSYIREIPAADVKMPGLEYFIMGILTNRAMITTPASNPYYAPYEIAVTPTTGSMDEFPQQSKIAPKTTLKTKSGIQLETVILSPEPGERIDQNEVVIAVSFLGDVSQLNLNSIRLFIDDKNHTAKAKISKFMMSYVSNDLSSGLHQIRIELADNSGNRFDDVAWRFFVASDKEKSKEDEKKIPLTGNVFAEYKNEKFSDSTLTTTNLGANFRGKYGPVEYRGMLFITSREKPQFQPRNRLLLEVGTSWLGIKLGDTTPRFNELMLWGKRVRGFEAYLKLGIINLEFVTGETNRRIEGTPYNQLIDPITGKTRYFIPGSDATDPNNEIISTTGIYRYGTFQQNLTAGRVSFGSGKYFQLGMNLVKVRDDTSASTFGSQPKDNLVIGPDIVLALDNHRIEFKASAAFSLLANDISNGAISAADLDSALGDIPFDPSDYAQYFILNTSLIPLDPSQLNSLGYQASFKFNYFKNNINIFYKSIGSEYYSLANSYLRKDIQGFSIYDRIQLYSNQIYLNLGYDKYLEGLSYENDESESTEPTNFTALNIGVSFFPRKQYLPKVNLNWKKYDRDNELIPTPADSVNPINYQNKDISVQLGYDVQAFDLNHTFSISYIATDRADGYHRDNVKLANAIQMLSLRTVYQIPLTTVLSYATNRNKAGGGLYSFKYNMINIGADYDLFNRRLNLNGGINFTSVNSQTNIDPQGNQTIAPSYEEEYKRVAFNLGGNFQINRQHSLLLDMSFVNLNYKNSNAYKDSIIRFRYEFRY